MKDIVIKYERLDTDLVSVKYGRHFLDVQFDTYENKGSMVIGYNGIESETRTNFSIEISKISLYNEKWDFSRPLNIDKMSADFFFTIKNACLKLVIDENTPFWAK